MCIRDRINTLSLVLKRLVHAIEDNCDAANYGCLVQPAEHPQQLPLAGYLI